VPNDLWVLTGPPGSGKTAILDQLRGTIRCVDEPARRVLVEQRVSGGVGTPERDPARFVELLLEIAIADHEAASLGEGTVLFDRGIPDCVAYASHLGVDPESSVKATERYRYHSEVVLLEPWNDIYVTDEERTMSFEQTVAFHSVLVDTYDRAGYRLVVVPRGPPKDRADFMRGRLLNRDAANS
jgi:predicted ATPase